MQVRAVRSKASVETTTETLGADWMGTERPLITVPAALGKPLSPVRVVAANDLCREYLHGWQLYERILRALYDRFRGNTDLEYGLPKAIRLNQPR